MQILLKYPNLFLWQTLQYTKCSIKIENLSFMYNSMQQSDIKVQCPILLRYIYVNLILLIHYFEINNSENWISRNSFVNTDCNVMNILHWCMIGQCHFYLFIQLFFIHFVTYLFILLLIYSFCCLSIHFVIYSISICMCIL